MSAGCLYDVPLPAIAVTVQQDLWEIVLGSTKSGSIAYLELYNHTEVGDAQEEQLSIILKSGQTVSGSGGSTPSINPTAPSDRAASFTAEINNTTKANTGTILTHRPLAWNVRQESRLWLPEDWMYEFVGGRRFTIELATTPIDSITLSGVLGIVEYG